MPPAEGAHDPGGSGGLGAQAEQDRGRVGCCSAMRCGWYGLPRCLGRGTGCPAPWRWQGLEVSGGCSGGAGGNLRSPRPVGPAKADTKAGIVGPIPDTCSRASFIDRHLSPTAPELHKTDHTAPKPATAPTTAGCSSVVALHLILHAAQALRQWTGQWPLFSG